MTGNDFKIVDHPVKAYIDDKLGSSGTGGGNGSDMEHRVTALETTLATILPTLATKTDIADLRSEVHGNSASIIKWVVGAALGLGVAGITVMTFVLNNGAPKAPQQQAPIIINVPAPPPSQSQPLTPQASAPSPAPK